MDNMRGSGAQNSNDSLDEPRSGIHTRGRFWPSQIELYVLDPPAKPVTSETHGLLSRPSDKHNTYADHDNPYPPYRRDMFTKYQPGQQWY